MSVIKYFKSIYFLFIFLQCFVQHFIQEHAVYQCGSNVILVTT